MTEFEWEVFNEVIKHLKLSSLQVNLIVKGSNFFFAVFGHVGLVVLEWSLSNEISGGKDISEIRNLFLRENVEQLTLATEFEIKEKLSNDGILLRASLGQGCVELIDDSEMCSGASTIKLLSDEVSQAKRFISGSLQVDQLGQK